MAETSLLIQLLLLLLLLLHSISASVTTTSSSPSLPPTADYINKKHELTTTFPSPTLLSFILSSLGFHELSSVAAAANLSASTPLTIFAPSDASLITCPSCSLPLLLKELTVPGLYPLRFLHNLAFGTKIETLAASYCLTITTSNDKDSKFVFVNGVQIAHPDLFHNGVVLIHGLQGFVTHLSPLSCNVQRMTSLSFPHHNSGAKLPSPAAHFSIMPLMLKDAIARLGHSGYNILAIALNLKFKEFSELKAMTIFAVDDVAFFSSEGYTYLFNFQLHVVPNRRIMAAELASLPRATLMPTMQLGQKLAVTTSGVEGPLASLKINYVRISTLNLLQNSRIVVHAVTTPFPTMHHLMTPEELQEGKMRLPKTCDVEWSDGGGLCKIEASEPAGPGSTVDVDDHHGL